MVLTQRSIGRLVALVGMVRPLGCIQAMVYTLSGAYLGGNLTDLLSRRVLLAALLVGLVMAYGFVINDYYDVAVDRLNRPERAIPSGRISRFQAGVFGLILVVTAAPIALTLGPGLAAFAFATLVLTSAYSHALKDTVLLGNMTIALLDGSIILFGSLASGHLGSAVLLVFILIFFYITAQEILFTLKDRSGDKEAGLRTIATRWGTERSLHVFRICILLFVIGVLLPALLRIMPSSYLYSAIPCTILPTLAIASLVSLRPSPPTFTHAADLMKVVWLLSLIPIILLK